MKRKKDGEFFIGMVDTYASSQRYKKARKRKKTKVVFKRILIIALCVLLIGGIGAASYFYVVPAVKGWIENVRSATPDEATPDEETTAAPTTAAPTTVAPTTVAPTTVAPTEPKDQEFITPVIEDNGKDGTQLSSTLYLWNDMGFNLFFSGDKVAKNYASTINGMAKALGNDITVYNMVVPNHTEFGLPKRIIDSGVRSDSQANNIKVIYDNTNKNVTDINCYNELSKHSTEYIYYNTDHHWTSLGAYYGYTAFCEEVGLTPLDITKLEKNSISGFTGSFYGSTGNAALKGNPDTVEYYTLPNKTSAQMKERMSSDTLSVPVYYPAATSGSLTYGVFCWGDTAQFVIKSDCDTGKKIAIVKDSYGNALAPYLTAHYDEVHLIDYRYWSGNLKDYMNKNGIDEVLILNNTMSANNTSQVASMNNVVG